MDSYQPRILDIRQCNTSEGWELTRNRSGQGGWAVNSGEGTRAEPGIRGGTSYSYLLASLVVVRLPSVNAVRESIGQVCQ